MEKLLPFAAFETTALILLSPYKMNYTCSLRAIFVLFQDSILLLSTSAVPHLKSLLPYLLLVSSPFSVFLKLFCVF